MRLNILAQLNQAFFSDIHQRLIFISVVPRDGCGDFFEELDCDSVAGFWQV
jgi:hypothetical protein